MFCAAWECPWRLWPDAMTPGKGWAAVTMKLLWGSWRTIRNFLVPRDYGEGSSWVHDVWHIMHISTRIWGCSMACKVCKLLNVFSILLCCAVFLGWSFSLQCSQKTRWVCGTRGEVYLSHKQYWPMKSSSLILQHTPIWVAAGYSLTKLSLGQSVLNRKASLMDLLTKVIRRVYTETHSLLLWLIICKLQQELC